MEKKIALKSFPFTINNYTLTDFEQLAALPCTYLIVGAEIGKDGTPHLQGYCELPKKTVFNTIKSYIPRAHIERRKGSAKENRTYCIKQGDFYEYGTISQQGHRSDLDAIRSTALDEGMRGVTAIGSYQQIRVASAFLTYHEAARDWTPEVTWIWGPTGTGKSKSARERLVDLDVYVKNDGTKWWDGYDGHDAVIIDDFRDSWWPITYTLALLDRYEMRVEVKGGYRQFTPKKIIITSCKAPDTCYMGTGESIQQLIRRINFVVPQVPEVGGNTSAPTSSGEEIPFEVWPSDDDFV